MSTSQLIDGEFPAVDRLYADEYPIHAVINKQALIDAIKRVSLVAERNAPIRMVFSGQELTLSAGTADEAQAKEILDIDMDGEDITVAFNPSYLVDGLSAISEPFVRMKMTTGGQARGNSTASRKRIPTNPWTTVTCSFRCASTTDFVPPVARTASSRPGHHAITFKEFRFSCISPVSRSTITGHGTIACLISNRESTFSKARTA